MNKVELIGRTTKDIELRYTEGSQTAFTRFTLAVQRRKKVEGQPDADFINCQAWKTTAELLEKYVKKGDRIAIAGRLNVSSYEKDGKKVYNTEVIVDEVEFLEPKNKEQKQAEEEPSGIPQGFAMTDEDIPF